MNWFHLYNDGKLPLSHKKRDWEFIHRGKHDESLCDKIHALAEAVDFQHAKHNFFSAFLHVQDQVKDRVYGTLQHRDSFVDKLRTSKLFRKKTHHISKTLSDTKQRVLEVMHMDEIIEHTLERVKRRKTFEKHAQATLSKISHGTADVLSTNIVQPVREVCDISVLRRFFHNISAGLQSFFRPLFASARVFGVFTAIFALTFTLLNIEAIGTVTGDYLKTSSMFSKHFQTKEAQHEYIETESLAPAPKDLVLAEEEREENIQEKPILPLNLDVTPDDNRIVIPRIGRNVPITDVSDETVIYSERLADIEDSLQEALQDGIVRYPGTAIPGQQGNVFLTGHSSYYLFAPGDYKDVLALLHKVELGDEIIVYYNQKKVVYKVNEIKEVWPNQVEILEQTNDYRLTLMTCTPIGTNLKRLVVTALQVE